MLLRISTVICVSCIGQKGNNQGLCCCYFGCDILVIWRPLLPWLQACSCTAGSFVGRGFEGKAAVQQRGRKPGSCMIQVHFFLKTPDCSFKCKYHKNVKLRLASISHRWLLVTSAQADERNKVF